MEFILEALLQILLYPFRPVFNKLEKKINAIESKPLRITTMLFVILLISALVVGAAYLLSCIF